ncbi:MAG: N-acetylmuramic acid 6-phosphate etherase [Victivallaceae bacterium]|nr:N-acetylmuramic acid 6-phosphate etherase [Victivallaceae bacterium]
MNKYLAIDVGGTWLKAAVYMDGRLSREVRVASRMGEGDISGAIREAAGKLDLSGGVSGIGVATAGIVDYAGTGVVRAADHLKALCLSGWRDALERDFSAPCMLINDADAALIAARRLELVGGGDRTALLAVGTGLGCAVIRKCHRVRPGRMLPLVGSIRPPEGGFDRAVSAVGLSGGDLCGVFRRNPPELKTYLDRLIAVSRTVCILYNLDSVLLTGGLCSAAAIAGFDLEGMLNAGCCDPVPELGVPIRIKAAAGNLPLLGAGLLAEGAAWQGKKTPPSSRLATERPLFGDLELTSISPDRLAGMLNSAENDAAGCFAAALPGIAAAGGMIAERMKRGGRIVYLGAGTSGRLAAVDAVELPCTYGISEEDAVALVAGGNDDAALTIETDGEEDASSVPELLLLNLNENDTVIGISASGRAFFVNSGLNYAASRGALTVLISESAGSTVVCDLNIPLGSGSEIVAGSTRMKAGTATKKALNFISTIAMIKLGRTRKSRMVNMRMLNEKLRLRAGLMQK